MTRFRALTLNVLVPILLAWLLVEVLHTSKTPIAVEQTPGGVAFGPISMRARLPGTSGGIPEPIIVCGVPGRASLVYIRLMSHARAKVGVEFWGTGKFESEPFDLPAADAQIDITCLLPAFFPSVGDPRWGGIPPSVQKWRNTEYLITVNGIDRLEGRIEYELPKHSPIYLGANPVGGSFVSNLFTGKILFTSQSFNEPDLIERAPNGDSFGAITMRARLPGANGGIPEPMVVCGIPGKASLVFIRLMSNTRMKVGVEFWGIGEFESEAFDLPAENAQIEMTCFLPAFFPSAGDPHWGRTPSGEQTQRNTGYLITVNGVDRLKGRIDYEQPKHSRISFGSNPVGGSFVSSLFTGMILNTSQAF